MRTSSPRSVPCSVSPSPTGRACSTIRTWGTSRRVCSGLWTAKRAAFDEAEATLFATLAEQDDLVALDEALDRLRELEPRHARVVELRHLTGLSIEETAEVLGVSTPTVKRDWRTAKAWLYQRLDAPSA